MAWDGMARGGGGSARRRCGGLGRFVWGGVVRVGVGCWSWGFVSSRVVAIWWARLGWAWGWLWGERGGVRARECGIGESNIGGFVSLRDRYVP